MRSKLAPPTVLAVIRWHIGRFGYAPSVREIATELDVATSTAKRALDELEREGMIERARGRARAIRITGDDQT